MSSPDMSPTEWWVEAAFALVGFVSAGAWSVFVHGWALVGVVILGSACWFMLYRALRAIARFRDYRHNPWGWKR